MRGALAAGLLLAVLLAPAARADQIDDSTYVPRVAKPAFTGRRPVVMIDGSHNNYFSLHSRYRALASLFAQDGARVIPGVQRFSAPLLAGCQVLVVADALGAREVSRTGARALSFQAAECAVLQDWVRSGGGLLLISDATPFAEAMRDLFASFGVNLGYGATIDTHAMDPEIADPGCLLFTRRNGLLLDHPITRGRNRKERIERVVTFSGQSLLGPPGSQGLLRLSPSAADTPPAPGLGREADAESERLSRMDEDLKAKGMLPAAGRFQGLAFTLGKGRVVVLGEAAVFGAQKVIGDDARVLGKDELLLGMNRPGLDNAQFALNILHWLAGVLN